MDIDVAPASSERVPIVVVVGGVHIARDAQSNSSRPMMSVSVSINSPSASIATCRRFAEKLQNLLRSPEICDS